MCLGVGVAQLVQRLATDWTVRGSNPGGGGGEIFCTRTARPGAHPACCTMGTGSFPGVKRPGRGADHPPPTKCRGQERVGLYLYSPSGPQWPATGRNFTFIFTFLSPTEENSNDLDGVNTVRSVRAHLPE